MAAKSMVGGINEAPSAFVLTDLAGSETVSAAVPAGKIGLIVDSGVNLRSHNINVLADQLKDAFIEQVSKLA